MSKEISGYYYGERAWLYEKLENYNAAIDDLSTILQHVEREDPAHLDIYSSYYYGRGILYQKIGKNSKAQADFVRARQLGWKY